MFANFTYLTFIALKSIFGDDEDNAYENDGDDLGDDYGKVIFKYISQINIVMTLQKSKIKNEPSIVIVHDKYNNYELQYGID